ncbi:hypothetical protein F4680DRAFT_442959 [Xylaria scruposa]|nr:hypothetical protein F4680DRAFT_442959 [Xylaria scruposa]
MSEPAGFATYQQVLSRTNTLDTSENQRASEVTGHPKTEDNDTIFNSKFEDVKEIVEDGETVIVTRTQNQYKRTHSDKKRFGEYSLLLRRIIDLDNKTRSWLQLEIQSDILRAEFSRLAKDITSISLHHDPIVIREPYREIFYCRDKIRDSISTASTQQLRQELQLLIDFQRQYMSKAIEAIKSFKQSGTIDFEWLWGLFAPSTEVVIQNTTATVVPIEWCAVVKSYQVSVHDGTQYWVVSLSHTGFNGQRFGTVLTSFTFPSFSGTIPIIELPVYPLEFCEHKQSLRDHAIARGKKFEQYCIKSSKGSNYPIGSPMVYRGPFWSGKRREDDYRETRAGYRMHDNPSSTIEGRVVVDVEGLFSRIPVLRDTLVPELNKTTNVEDSSSDDDISFLHSLLPRQSSLTGWSPGPLRRKALSPDQYSTCPPFIPAFSFKTRSWGLVLIDELGEVPWDTSVYTNLQIDVATKETLSRLINSHSTHSDSFDDFVQGKGRGLVVLLYGPPGSGKTMTAVLREITLFRDWGELGTSVSSIQRGLEEAFSLAARWDTILLIDEADAFLSERRGDSIERNALISVFLKLLEYQTGILFLTTNRFFEFDKAFRSRIHALIPYPELTIEQRGGIWKTLAYEKCGCNLSDEEWSVLGKLPIDGRAIKNVLRLASLLSKSRDAEDDVTFSDIQTVLPLTVHDMEERGHVDAREVLEKP